MHELGSGAGATAAPDVVADSPLAGSPSPPVEPPATNRVLGFVARNEIAHRYAVIGVWVLMLLVYIAIEPSKMLQAATFQSIFGSQEDLVFPALAAVATFIVGEFDLSVAFIMGLCATALPVLVVLHGVNVVAACFIVVGIGIACGLVNGFFAVVVGVNGLIVTLGSGSLMLGVSLLISDSQTVSGLSVNFGKIDLYSIGGLPISFFYGIVLAAIFAYIVSFTPLGRHMTFVGASREVARLAGVRVNRIRFLSYVASGLLCSLGGILLAASLGGFDSSASSTYLLPALSAVFLGTAVIQPGRFNPIGTMVGIYFLATGIMGLELLGLGGWIEDAFYGAALVIAVSLAEVVRRRRGAS